jgi:hypothetical protein
VLAFAIDRQAATWIRYQRHMEAGVVPGVGAFVGVLIERGTGRHLHHENPAQLAPVDRGEKRPQQRHKLVNDGGQQVVIERRGLAEVAFERETVRPAQEDAFGPGVRTAQEILAQRDRVPPFRVRGQLLCQRFDRQAL